MTRLQQHWKAVLATFFPRWKAAAGWRCTNRGRRGQAHGHSEIERRLIEILFVSEDDDALDMLLIHEISHAVASLKHGKTWQRRLALAAATARKLGRTRLAELLEAEINNYQNHGEGLPQEWTIDLEQRTKTVQTVGRRQVRPMQGRLDVQPIAEEIAVAILAGRPDDRLKWDCEDHVRLLIGEVLPAGSAVKETLAGRRKRLRQAVAALVASAEWEMVKASVFEWIKSDGGSHLIVESN